MNLQEYTVGAKKTITYKTHKELLACTTLSLSGELSEYVEHMERKSNRTLISKELGDILWGLAVLSDHLGMELDSDTVSRYYNLQKDGMDTVAKIHEIIKKVIRDKDWIADDVDKLKLQPLLEALLCGIKRECAIQLMNMSDVYTQNLEKLASRAERGVLQGSGDCR